MASKLLPLACVILLLGALVVWQPWADAGAGVPDGADVGGNPAGAADPTTTSPGAPGGRTTTGGDPVPMPDDPGFQEPPPPARPGGDPVLDMVVALGWQESDPHVLQVFDWNEGVRRTRDAFLKAHGPDADARAVRRAAAAFNETVLAQRKELVARVGEKLADHVLRTLPLYRFDLAAGTWHRVDAAGGRLPFADPKTEDIWSAFKRR